MIYYIFLCEDDFREFCCYVTSPLCLVAHQLQDMAMKSSSLTDNGLQERAQQQTQHEAVINNSPKALDLAGSNESR